LKAHWLTKTAEKKDEWQGLKIIVGLGNPGKNYESTRHNVGFRVVDRIGIEYGATFSPEKHLKAEVSKISSATQPVLLVKPSTYMNLSGLSVGALASWYKVELEDFLIIHDDVSLPLGRLRFQKAGGAGGQHGVESIIDTLGGAKHFNRLKVGVGPDPGGDLRAGYVLSAVPETDRPLYEKVIERSAQAASSWVGQDIDKVMNQFNNTDLREPPQAVPAEKSEGE
ncbi:MAG: aminoacyl-tRNA hydrolase, partial [Candidatus Melainabacteria bacterium]